VLRVARREPSAILFAVHLLGLLLYPVMRGSAGRAHYARSLVMIEQIAGVGYVAMVVSRLVGLLVLRRRPAG
jgi:hypothetical protein